VGEVALDREQGGHFSDTLDDGPDDHTGDEESDEQTCRSGIGEGGTDTDEHAWGLALSLTDFTKKAACGAKDG
jgi:hypothetical protein